MDVWPELSRNSAQNGSARVTGIKPLREVARELVIEAISQSRGDTALAAKLLGISRTTVYRKMRDLGIVADKSQQKLFPKCK